MNELLRSDSGIGGRKASGGKEVEFRQRKMERVEHEDGLP